MENNINKCVTQNKITMNKKETRKTYTGFVIIFLISMAIVMIIKQ
tara:strand:+ start:464 stop:598 length:135 start_codon:yes stop_codon:yes gene_type:complete